MSCYRCKQEGHEAWACSNSHSAQLREHFKTKTVTYTIATTRAVHLYVEYSPPKSPHNLIQESIYDDPWKVLVACLILNRTSGTQMRPAVMKLFEKYPTPRDFMNGDIDEITEILKPCGLWRKRPFTIQKMTRDYLQKDWEFPTELFGVGKYASDAYLIFCCGRWQEVAPQDHMLANYVSYLQTISNKKSDVVMGEEKEDIPAVVKNEEKENFVNIASNGVVHSKFFLKRDSSCVKQEFSVRSPFFVRENFTKKQKSV